MNFVIVTQVFGGGTTKDNLKSSNIWETSIPILLLFVSVVLSWCSLRIHFIVWLFRFRRIYWNRCWWCKYGASRIEKSQPSLKFLQLFFKIGAVADILYLISLIHFFFSFHLENASQQSNSVVFKKKSLLFSSTTINAYLKTKTGSLEPNLKNWEKTKYVVCFLIFHLWIAFATKTHLNIDGLLRLKQYI